VDLVLKLSQLLLLLKQTPVFFLEHCLQLIQAFLELLEVGLGVLPLGKGKDAQEGL